jgi:hypothetical protein
VEHPVHPKELFGAVSRFSGPPAALVQREARQAGLKPIADHQ